MKRGVNKKIAKAVKATEMKSFNLAKAAETAINKALSLDLGAQSSMKQDGKGPSICTIGSRQSKQSV